MESPLNLKFSPEDVRQASRIRKEFQGRFDREPVFDSARAALDRATYFAPEQDDELARVPSIVRRNREAFAHLKASLASIRSKGSSFFDDTLPATRGESTVRVLVAADCVSSSSSSVPVEQPPTSVTGNLRPHNAESFRGAREIFLKGTEDSLQNNIGVDGEEVMNGIRLRAKLSSSAARAEVERVVNLVSSMLPPPAKKQTCISVSEDGYLNVTAVNYKASKDPLEKIIAGVAAATSKARGGEAGESSFAHDTSAPDVFRLATLRIDIPHDLGDWLVDKHEASWATLTEGVRIAFEAITRDACSEHAFPDIARIALGGSDAGTAELVKAGLGVLGAVAMAKENSLEIRLAPTELLFALGVESAAIPNRASFLGTLASCPTESFFEEGSDDRTVLKAFLESTALEEQLAATIAAKLKLGGTSTRLRRVISYALGLGFMEKKSGGKAAVAAIVDSILPFKNMIEEIASISLISKSGSVELDLKGINGKLWRWLPNTCQEAVDAAKPLILACTPLVKFSDDGSKMFVNNNDSDEPTEIDLETFAVTPELKVRPPLVFVASVKDEGKTALESVWIKKAGKCPPDVVLHNPVLTVERAQPKSRTSSSSSTAWDLPLPSAVVDIDEAIEEGQKYIELRSSLRGIVGSAQDDESCSEEGSGNSSSSISISGEGEGEEGDDDGEGQIRISGSLNVNDDGARAAPTATTATTSRSTADAAAIGGGDDDREQFRLFFDMFDEDKSGYLERSEAMSAFLCFYPEASASELLTRLRAADVNGDGKLDFVEFAKIATDAKNNMLVPRSDDE